MENKYRTDVAKVLARAVRAETGCLEWAGMLNASGYGMTSVRLERGGIKQMQAHRLAFEYANGEIPDGLIVRHRCHNRKCIDPDHLLSGTRADNVRDRTERFRTARMTRAAAVWEAKEAAQRQERSARRLECKQARAPKPPEYPIAWEDTAALAKIPPWPSWLTGDLTSGPCEGGLPLYRPFRD